MEIFIEWLYEENQSEVYDGLIGRSIMTALEHEGVTLDVELSVTILDNDQMKAINLDQRGIDQATDVLSFPMIDFDGMATIAEQVQGGEVNPETNLVYLGDIVISWDKVLEQKEAYGHSTERELSFLLVHSVLHLLGYDHLDDEEERIMILRQKEIMTDLGLER